MKVKMEELLAQTGVTYDTLNKTLDVSSNPHFEDHLNLVKDLQGKIVELQVTILSWNIIIRICCLIKYRLKEKEGGIDDNIAQKYLILGVIYVMWTVVRSY